MAIYDNTPYGAGWYSKPGCWSLHCQGWIQNPVSEDLRALERELRDVLFDEDGDKIYGIDLTEISRSKRQIFYKYVWLLIRSGRYDDAYSHYDSLLSMWAHSTAQQSRGGLPATVSPGADFVEIIDIIDILDDYKRSQIEIDIQRYIKDISDENARRAAEIIYNSPYGDREGSRLIRELDKLLGGHGIEPIQPEGYWHGGYMADIAALYVNMGDTYNTTVIFDVDSGEMLLTSWGDWYQAWEEEHGGGEVIYLEDEAITPSVTWHYTDDTMCEHGEPACEECEAEDRYMVGVFIEAPRNIGDYVGAPFGSSWECPSDMDICYASAMVMADIDVQAALEAEFEDEGLEVIEET